MNRGFSLLEFLVASSMFTAIILGGCQYLDGQLHLQKRLLGLTRPEAEMNYRMLVIRSCFNGCARSLQADPFLAEAPVIFPGLGFGKEPEENALSVSCSASAPARFVRETGGLRISNSLDIQPNAIILLAGVTSAGVYGWTYERVNTVTDAGAEKYLETVSLTSHDSPDTGSLIDVQVQGLAFRNGILFWVQPSGELSPFMELDDFHKSIIGRSMTIQWRIGYITAEFEVLP
jgi:hypothetical protein